MQRDTLVMERVLPHDLAGNLKCTDIITVVVMPLSNGNSDVMVPVKPCQLLIKPILKISSTTKMDIEGTWII